MKNSLVLLFCILCAVHYANAQITLTQSSYPVSVVGTDSLKKTAHNSSFPVLTVAAGGTWDMSITTDTIPFAYRYIVPATPAQFADSNNYSFAGYGYQGNVQSSVTSTGLISYGLKTLGVKYDISPITLGSSDTLYILNQYSLYSSPATVLSFPATYNSSWSSVYTSDLNFELSAATFSLNHTPGIYRRHITQKDTVTGWGKMRIKDANNIPAAYFDVLQVQTATFVTDSIYINNTPAPGLLLLALNLTQGKRDTIYEQCYYRSGEITPLARVRFKDAAYTQPLNAFTHVQRLMPAAINDADQIHQFNVYPNPIAGNAFSVDVTGNGHYSYQVKNILGVIVQSGMLTTNHTEIVLQLSLSEGIYYLVLRDQEKHLATKFITIGK